MQQKHHRLPQWRACYGLLGLVETTSFDSEQSTRAVCGGSFLFMLRFVLPEGTPKVVYKPDTKLENAGTFTIMQEDHTVGNLIRMQLHADKHNVFAGYRIPHPLETRLVIKVQTTGVKTPLQSVAHALEDLRSELNTLQTQLDQAFLEARTDTGSNWAM